MIGTSLRFGLVKSHENDIKMTCDASWGKEAFKPIPSKRDTGIMAVIIDVWLTSWLRQLVGHEIDGRILFTVYQANVGSCPLEISVLSWEELTILAQRVEFFWMSV